MIPYPAGTLLRVPNCPSFVGVVDAGRKHVGCPRGGSASASIWNLLHYIVLLIYRKEHKDVQFGAVRSKSGDHALTTSNGGGVEHRDHISYCPLFGVIRYCLTFDCAPCSHAHLYWYAASQQNPRECLQPLLTLSDSGGYFAAELLLRRYSKVD